MAERPTGDEPGEAEYLIILIITSVIESIQSSSRRRRAISSMIDGTTLRGSRREPTIRRGGECRDGLFRSAVQLICRRCGADPGYARLRHRCWEVESDGTEHDRGLWSLGGGAGRRRAGAAVVPPGPVPGRRARRLAARGARAAARVPAAARHGRGPAGPAPASARPRRPARRAPELAAPLRTADGGRLPQAGRCAGRLPAVLGLHDHGGNKYFGWRKIAQISDRSTR